MALTETPPETVDAASDTTPDALPVQPKGFAGLLGTGDHKVIGRLYIITGLLFGALVVGIGEAVAIEAITPATYQVFTPDTGFQFFTLFRVGTIFLLALPLTIGVAMVMVPLQVGARSIAFPRAAASSYWTWLLGASLLLASYAMNGGPNGGSDAGVNLWIASMGVLVISVMVAAISLATTVFALRAPGLSLARVPFYAWSVGVAAVMWLMTLPMLLGLVVLMYVDHRHGASSIGSSAGLYARLGWLFRNPQIYTVAIPVLGFALDVLTTTSKVRASFRGVAQGAIAAFGVLSFGAFLAVNSGTALETPLVIAMALLAVLPILVVLGSAADLFRRGSFSINAGAAYAVSALLVLLLGVAAGALGSIPALETVGTVYDLGTTHALVLAAVIGALGGMHWWSTKIFGNKANAGLGLVAPLLLLVGAALVVIPDFISGIFGTEGELAPDFTGGIKGLNIVIPIGIAIVALGLLTSLAALRPATKRSDDTPDDPWEGQTLEWLTASPPPLENFDVEMPEIQSAEPLLDMREEK